MAQYDGAQPPQTCGVRLRSISLALQDLWLVCTAGLPIGGTSSTIQHRLRVCTVRP